MAASTMLVRIKPTNAREAHTAHGVTIRKKGGWHQVPVATAKALGKERMGALNPDASPFVFDVSTSEEALEIVLEETAVADPAGTVDKPRVVAPSGTAAPPPDVSAPAGRGRGRAAGAPPSGEAGA